jgi:hypothetical protein
MGGSDSIEPNRSTTPASRFGRSQPKTFLRSVVARLLGRKPLKRRLGRLTALLKPALVALDTRPQKASTRHCAPGLADKSRVRSDVRGET